MNTILQSITHTIVKKKFLIIGILVVLVGLGVYYWKGGSTTATTGVYSVHQVAQGTVTTGIQTTGTIEAAEILDLNIYKLTSRIDSVGVTNGTKVAQGDLLFSFDQSDTSVAVNEARLKLQEAQLALTVARGTSGDANTTVTTLQNDIMVLERSVEQGNEKLRGALRTFLNADATAEPSKARYETQVEETAPTIGGTYNGTERGEYRIYVYASAEDSGYSYRLEGLETGTYPVRPGTETKLGTQGLTITFSASDLSPRDEWIVALPNTYAAEYAINLEDYNQSVADAKKSIASDSATLANKRILLAQAERGDTTAQRSVDVQSAELAVERARVDLEDALNGQTERRIRATFSGTVEGMQNVVAGATPTKDSNDPINFGALISDEFHVTFSLSASDVDRVSKGQKVLVTLTSVPNSAPLTGEITEISSLPESSTVAQYQVTARMVENASSTVRLRDGMLADIEIVRDEKTDVVRVPTSAVTYRDGLAYVNLIDGLSDEQKTRAVTIGVVPKSAGITTYERTIETGLTGQYYTEVTRGLNVGDIIVVSSITADATAGEAVVRTGFGAGGPPGERRATQD